MNRLKEKYLNEVVSSLMNKYNYKSVMEVPKLEKIVINMGVGDATGNSKLLDIEDDFIHKLYDEFDEESADKIIIYIQG